MEQKGKSATAGASEAVINQNQFTNAIGDIFQPDQVKRELSNRLHVAESKITVSRLPNSGWEFKLDQGDQPLHCRLVPEYSGAR
jgi:hypothetical protein